MYINFAGSNRVVEGGARCIQQAIDDLSEKIKHKMEGFRMNKKILIADDSALIRLLKFLRSMNGARSKPRTEGGTLC